VQWLFACVANALVRSRRQPTADAIVEVFVER
jgi:hypothetical protein